MIAYMQNYDIVDLAGLRLDGRKANELRSMRHNLGIIESADGSAYFEQGLNKVLVIVHGPHEPKNREAASEKVNVQFRCALCSIVEFFLNIYCVAFLSVRDSCKIVECPFQWSGKKTTQQRR